MTFYILENFEKYFLETLVQIESNSQNFFLQLLRKKHMSEVNNLYTN